MRATLRRRLAVLESKLYPAKTVSNLDHEIRTMTSTERNALRNFLLYIKNGGERGDASFDELKLNAENALYSARARLKISC